MRFFGLCLLLTAGLLLAGPSRAATEMDVRNAITGPTGAEFFAERCDQLEEASRLYRTQKARTPSGIWKLSIFYSGLRQAFDIFTANQGQESAFRDLEGKTTRWTQRYPTSPSAHIAHADALISHGWAFRGKGLASTVKQENWAPFYKYIGMAREYLESHKSVAAVDPQWYETMLIIARAQNWPRDQFDRLLDEALDREPLFYETYFRALEYLLPKWHGGLAEMDAFAQDAVRRTSKQEGRAMYARIYWYASALQEFKNDIFADALASWPLMREGFDDMVARYSDDWNLNNYARFACLARDKPKTRELLKRTQSTIIHEAWRSTIIPNAWHTLALRERCSAWALGD